MQFGPPVNAWVVFYTNALFYFGVIRDNILAQSFHSNVQSILYLIFLEDTESFILFFFYLHITDEILQANSVGQHFGVRKCKVDGQEINGTRTIFQEAVNLFTFKQS